MKLAIIPYTKIASNGICSGYRSGEAVLSTGEAVLSTGPLLFAAGPNWEKARELKHVRRSVTVKISARASCGGRILVVITTRRAIPQ